MPPEIRHTANTYPVFHSLPPQKPAHREFRLQKALCKERNVVFLTTRCAFIFHVWPPLRVLSILILGVFFFFGHRSRVFSARFGSYRSRMTLIFQMFSFIRDKTYVVHGRKKETYNKRSRIRLILNERIKKNYSTIRVIIKRNCRVQFYRLNFWKNWQENEALMKCYFIILLFEHIQSKFIEPSLQIFYKFLNHWFFLDNLPIIINDHVDKN